MLYCVVFVLLTLCDAVQVPKGTDDDQKMILEQRLKVNIVC